MSLITRMRRQRAVYWKQNGNDRFGKIAFLPPVEIKCRWVDATEDVRGTQGDNVGFNTKVYVDREMSVGDRLKKGEMESNVAEDPHDDPAAIAIQRFGITPNLHNTENLYTAFL